MPEPGDDGHGEQAVQPTPTDTVEEGPHLRRVPCLYLDALNARGSGQCPAYLEGKRRYRESLKVRNPPVTPPPLGRPRGAR